MSDIKKHLEKIQKEEAASNFAKWFKNDGILDDDGEPQVLYAGTLSDFSQFDITHTRPEAHFGQGFYMTTSSDDASYNYATPAGPDHKLMTGEAKDKFVNDPEHFLETNYKDVLESTDDIEINNTIRRLYNLSINNEETDNEDFDAIFNHHEEAIFKRTHEGFVFPLFLVSRKLMDVDNHVFESTEEYGDFDDLINYFNENHSNVAYDIKIGLEALLSSSDDEAYPDVDEILAILEEALDSCGLDIDDEDDLESINAMKDYITQYYEIDDERCLTYKMGGELQELKGHIADILREYSMDQTADSFIQSFDEEFPHYSESVSAIEFLNNNAMIMALCDAYLEVDNIYDMHVSGVKAIFSLAIQRIGYDTIKMNPEEAFEMKHIEGASHYISFNPLNIKSAIGNNGEYSLTDTDILHRVTKNVHDAVRKENSISYDDAERIVSDLRRHYKNMPNCEIHTNLKDIPNFIVGKDTNIESCSGWYDTHRKSIHLYLPNIMDKKELEKTICHEVFGHLSLREIMGSNYERTMNKVYDYYDKKGELEEVKNTYIGRYNLNLDNKKDRAIIAEEKMADVVEQNGFKQFPLKNIIIGAIRDNIRKIVSNLNINENDITYMMYQSHKNMLDHSHKNYAKRHKIKMP